MHPYTIMTGRRHAAIMKAFFRRALPVLLGALCLAVTFAVCVPRHGAPKTPVPGRALHGAAPQSGAQAGALVPYSSGTAFACHAGQNSLYRTVNAIHGQGTLVARLDLAAMQESVLCSVPGCAHDSEACPAFFSGYGEVYAAGEVIYSISSAREADGSIRSGWRTLRAHAPDGSAVREVAQVNFLEWGTPFAAYGTKIYRTYGNELRVLDLASGHETILSRQFTPQSGAVFASSDSAGPLPDGRLVLIFQAPQQFIFCAMDAQGALSELCRLPAENFGGGCFDGADYYYSDAATGSLYVLDTLTGKVRHFSDALCRPGTEGGSGWRTLRMLGGRLAVQLSTGTGDGGTAAPALRLFVFPLSGGQPAEVTLTDFFNGYLHPLQVLAETPAGFLVTGDRPYAGTAVIRGQDGGSYTQDVYTEQLALISPEDYFSSNPSFRFFEQLPQPLPS